jgi:hypothetical protein
MITITPIAVGKSLIRNSTSTKISWKHGANTHSVQVISEIALNASSLSGVISSSVPVNQAIRVGSSLFANVLSVHGKPWQTSVATIDSGSVCVAESTVFHQLVVGVGHLSNAHILEVVGESGFAVLAWDVASIVINAVWGGSSCYACSALEFGSCAESACVSTWIVTAACASRVAFVDYWLKGLRKCGTK